MKRRMGWQEFWFVAGAVAGYGMAVLTEQFGFPYPGILYRICLTSFGSLVGVLAYWMFTPRDST